MAQDLGTFIGFTALSRHGALGIVVDVDRDVAREPALVVRGGVSASLLYFVPCGRVSEVSPEQRTVFVDADLADFDSSLRGDGTIVLRAAR